MAAIDDGNHRPLQAGSHAGLPRWFEISSLANNITYHL